MTTPRVFSIARASIFGLWLASATASAAASYDHDHAAAAAPGYASDTGSAPKAGTCPKGPEPCDEAMGGMTARGTPIEPRGVECFPAEARDVFWEMDQVASGPTPEVPKLLQPLNFDLDGANGVDEEERKAIRGRNTWLLWGGGNEAFWNWLQEEGYGLVDFLILMDSRQRGSRFRRTGLINQPGFQGNADLQQRVLGLWLDRPIPGKVMLTTPPHETAQRPQPPPGCKSGNQLFVPYNDAEVNNVRKQLGYDGLDPDVYGYPSGIFGLRLMLNPDFFAKTPDAARARAYWDERVAERKDSAYYTDAEINADPQLIRPFRVSMSCGFCHVAPHPLNPPLDPENPEWENLSSIIGDRSWNPQPAFGNLLPRGSFLHHFLGSQQAGTIDTSLISTDHINNANTINAVFDLPARLVRAKQNQAEKQGKANLLLPGEDVASGRLFPRVLIDGSDSIGVFGALIRVPLNIGTFPEEWARCDNPIIGFTPQRPFSIALNQANSVYWKVNEKYRVPYMAKFFTLKNDKAGRLGADGKPVGQSSTEAMLLADTPQGATIIAAERDAAWKGRAVFVDNCSICHSSKQPQGFKLEFTQDAQRWQVAPKPDADAVYAVPQHFADWEAFKTSAGYADYLRRITGIANHGLSASELVQGPVGGRDDPFIKDNYLSTEVRIPVTLTGTNSGRAAATNAKKGQVWDNYSSDDYKKLPAVGLVRYFNPFKGGALDEYGNNDEYPLDGDGPGYYRPPSLISLWATAPYLHNNALGVFKPILPGQTAVQAAADPVSVEARVAAFEDGIDRLLSNAARAIPGSIRSAEPSPGDLRRFRVAAASHDPGFIYRVPVDTMISFAPTFTRQLVEGVAGKVGFSFLDTWLWALLAALFFLLAWWAMARHAGFTLLVLALLGAPLLWALGITSWMAWAIVLILGAAGFGFLFTRSKRPLLPRLVFSVFFVLTVVAGGVTHQFLNGRLGKVNVGPIPAGTPVNLLMNMDPAKPLQLPRALLGVARAMIRIHREHLGGDEAYAVFAEEAGPALLAASKCPDFVLDRGHWFGEKLSEDEKKALKAFLKTL